jgi:hypothetical protein
MGRIRSGVNFRALSSSYEDLGKAVKIYILFLPERDCNCRTIESYKNIEKKLKGKERVMRLLQLGSVQEFA